MWWSPSTCPRASISTRPTSTRIAYLAAVDVLASLVAYAIQPQATVSLRKIKQQLVTHRDGGRPPASGRLTATIPVTKAPLRREAIS